MEFCQRCLKNNCTAHKWFTDQKLKTEKEVLIAELKHILEYGIIPRIVQKIHLVEHQYSDSLFSHAFSYISGSLVFIVNVPTSAIKDGIYIPVQMHSGKDVVLDYRIEIKADLMRHNPMTLLVKKSIFDDTILHSVQLIDFCDSLHMESMEDYHKIVKLASLRLNDFIKTLE